MGKAFEQSCADFTESLGSSAPSPGGGGAGALMGALAAALSSMSANITRGRKKYAHLQPELGSCAALGEELRLGFLRLMEEDEKAFLPLAALYSADKSGADYASRLAEASLAAAAPPMELMELAAKAAELAEQMLELGSPTLISDVGCAALAAAGALRAGAMNLFVNTRSLRALPEAAAMEARARALMDEYLPRAEAVAQRALEYLED